MNPPRTHLVRRFYALGVVNYALKDAAFGAFVLFYYKQVLGLSGVSSASRKEESCISFKELKAFISSLT